MSKRCYWSCCIHRCCVRLPTGEPALCAGVPVCWRRPMVRRAVSMSFDSGIVCEHPCPRPPAAHVVCLCFHCQRGLGTERLVC